ncbi:MAG: [FeFe] hydrogenase H-cluster radical SAM maturase HydE [Candidatus Omnitrophica bacterium]|nr:[FeFe] hydrogenase H-cluster radical SAM maturase HydE [Candidatus Omnitrophota bacterium]
MLSRQEISGILRNKDKGKARSLFAEADRLRRQYTGDDVHLRGIIEFSNHCRQDCLYCGLRRSNKNLIRYRMPPKEILSVSKSARRADIRTVVLQSGEDPQYNIGEFCGLIGKIKKLDVAVTVCIGECSYADYRRLKEAGADRYLLKFETSDAVLYKKFRPGNTLSRRLECLAWLKKLKFQVGSGIMVGLPGQTFESIAGDILIFEKLGLDMIGIGPFIPHPDTPLAGSKRIDLGTVLKVVAITRMVTGNAHIPATTAVGSIDAVGREKALQAGANVVMPDLTPARYRRYYDIYPGKICVGEDAEECLPCLYRRIQSIGRRVSVTRGDSLKL